MSRRRSKRSRTSRKRSRKKYNKPKGMTCKEFLRKKIAINMREYKSGHRLSNGRKITSPQQAIAIAYSQVRTNAKCKAA